MKLAGYIGVSEDDLLTKWRLEPVRPPMVNPQGQHMKKPSLTTHHAANESLTEGEIAALLADPIVRARLADIRSGTAQKAARSA